MSLIYLFIADLVTDREQYQQGKLLVQQKIFVPSYTKSSVNLPKILRNTVVCKDLLI